MTAPHQLPKSKLTRPGRRARAQHSHCLGRLLRLCNSLLDPDPERRGHNRRHSQGLPAPSNGQIQELADGASLLHPQGPRHLPIGHRQKCSYVDNSGPPSPWGHGNLVRKPNLDLSHDTDSHHDGRRRLPHDGPTLSTTNQNPPQPGPSMGALKPRMGTTTRTRPKRPPLLPR